MEKPKIIRLGKRKLTRQQIEDVRDAARYQRVCYVAHAFGVSKMTVYDAIHGRLKPKDEK